MTEIVASWPKKARELQNHHMDSTWWDTFDFRDDDIIVATYAKSGTTWTQQIVGQLVYAGDPNVAMTHRASSEMLAKAIPGAQFVILPGQKHNYFASAPETAHRIIRNFLWE